MTKFNNYKDLRRLYRRISARMERVELYNFGGEVAHTARLEFRNLKEQYGKPSRDMTDEQLRSMYRDLQYIDSLKTSTVRGSYNAAIHFQDISDMLDSLSISKKQEFWDIYGSIYARSGGLIEKFKYDILTEAKDLYQQYESQEDIIDKLIKKYDPRIQQELLERSSDLDEGVGLRLPYT